MKRQLLIVLGCWFIGAVITLLFQWAFDPHSGWVFLFGVMAGAIAVNVGLILSDS